MKPSGPSRAAILQKAPRVQISSDRLTGSIQLKGGQIDDLVAEGKRYWEAHAAAPDLTAMRMRSRVNEAEALLDPAGLGAFWVGEWDAPST